MTRKHFSRILLAAVLGLMALFASTSSLEAQNQKCCKYTVIVKGIPDKCLPFKVWTEWSSGSDIFVVDKNDIYFRPVPGKCPPEPDFKGVTLDGITFVGLGQTAKFVDANGCCYVVSAYLDNNSCVEILITPC